MQNNKSFVGEFQNFSQLIVVSGVDCLAQALTEQVPDAVSFRLIEILEAETNEWLKAAFEDLLCLTLHNISSSSLARFLHAAQLVFKNQQFYLRFSIAVLIILKQR
jgi:hypothetical protein